MADINVAELGISAMRPRRAATGGLVFVIRGARGAEQAGVLRSRLAERLGDSGIKVHCPVKTAEFRICGLTELASRESVCRAIAAQGGCEPGELSLGERRPDSSGLFSLWARGPVAAAVRLARAGSIAVDGLLARVVPLMQRRLQCFRCLEFGHVQAKCGSAVDRKLLCYRCGVEGHLARGCQAAPRCPVCADAGLPHDHRMGGPPCSPPSVKVANTGRGGRRAPGARGSVSPGALSAATAPMGRLTPASGPAATMPPPSAMETETLQATTSARAGPGKRKVGEVASSDCDSGGPSVATSARATKTAKRKRRREEAAALREGSPWLEPSQSGGSPASGGSPGDVCGAAGVGPGGSGVGEENDNEDEARLLARAVALSYGGGALPLDRGTSGPSAPTAANVGGQDLDGRASGEGSVDAI